MSDNNGWLDRLLSSGQPVTQAPSAMASIGRGAMDVWEPIKQTYLNLADPTQATGLRRYGLL